jgi:hypothetical protein
VPVKDSLVQRSRRKDGSDISRITLSAAEGRIKGGDMKRNTWCGMVLAGVLACAAVADAGTKSYQVTGPVLEMNDSMIVVQKGKERWEIARDASTKTKGEVKVGSKVTIMYQMTATQVEAKEAKEK